MPATFGYFQYPRAKAGGSSYYQDTSQKYSLFQGRGETVLGEMAGWGRRVTKASSSAPLAPKNGGTQVC